MTEKTLSAKALTRSSQQDQAYSLYFEILPEDIEYRDVFMPSFWRHHKNIRVHSIIRLRSAADKFDFDVVVRAIVAGGLVVEYRCGRVPIDVDAAEVAEAALTEAARLRVGPIAQDGRPVIRTQFLPKTKWRLIGLGAEEVKRDMPTQATAETEMAIYLASMHMRNPTDEELLAEAKRRAEAVKRADDAQTAAQKALVPAE